MTHIFNENNTRDFFNKEAKHISNVKVPREEIFFQIILPGIMEGASNEISGIDFGCGGGAILLRLLDNGIDAYGIEKHEELFGEAEKRLLEHTYSSDRLLRGGVEKLGDLDAQSFDIFLAMGVFQYLTPQEREALLNSVHRILRDNGHMICSFQNALFDLFTFNKYTLDFYENKLIGTLGIDSSTIGDILEDLKSLITFPDKPDYRPSRARDNIYVKTDNPLTIQDELKACGFELVEKYFYTFHFVPTLLEDKYKEALKGLRGEFEVRRSTDWCGYFMAGAFLVDCVKI